MLRTGLPRPAASIMPRGRERVRRRAARSPSVAGGAGQRSLSALGCPGRNSTMRRAGLRRTILPAHALSGGCLPH